MRHLAPRFRRLWIGPPPIGALSQPIFFGGRFGSPTQIDYRRKGTLILTSLLEDLAVSLSRNDFRVGGGEEESDSRGFGWETPEQPDEKPRCGRSCV